MTIRRRFRIALPLLVIAILVPVQVVLVQALTQQDQQQAVAAWVDRQSSEELHARAENIESYPELYRREILRGLDSAGRSQAWRAFLQRFLDRHPEFDDSTRQLLRQAMELASPELFARPTIEGRAQAAAIGRQLAALIGRDGAAEALVRLGPRDGTFASAEPLSMRMSGWVRDLMTALAGDEADCDCAPDFGCSGDDTCREGTGCAPDEDWPMCGWFLLDPCTGVCRPPHNLL